MNYKLYLVTKQNKPHNKPEPPNIYAHILRQTTTTQPRLLKESCTVNR